MPRSLVGSLLQMFSAASRDDGRRAAAKGARERGLFDMQLLPDAVSPITLDGNRLKHLRVGVVGAGFAGLAAAWYLRECGADVTVFEALDGVGGRVQTDREFIPGKIVEAGAELIGENHPMWLELADRFGLDLVELTTDRNYVDAGLRVRLRFGDRDLSPAEIEELHDGLLPHLDVIGEEARPIDPVRPWTAPDAQQLDGMSVADRLDQLGGLSPLQREAFEFTLGNDACAPVEVQSYLGLLALVSAGRTGDDTEGMRGYWEASEVFRCAQGNQALAERIAEMLDAEPGTVRTGIAVTRITISEEVGPARATITTADGATHEVDDVVLAVPAPQWSRIEIEPPLPAGEYAMTHGPAVKYLTAFDDLTWPGGGLAPSAKWDLLGSTWESTDRQQPAGQPFGLTVFSGGTHVLGDADAYRHRLAAFFPGVTPMRAELVDWRESGYSVPTVGQVTTVGQRLSRPHAGHLYVAGEQTSLGFYGYMEGALQSGARCANAVVREVLGSQLPAPSPSGICLPLGHLSGDTLAQRVRCEELGRELVRDHHAFAGDRVDQRYSFAAPGGGLAELRTICAIWPGTVGFDQQMVSVEMLPSLRLRLGTLFGEAAPIPVRATYGPVQPATTGETEVDGGAELGTLVGPDFTIRFQDQDGYHLHPLAVFELFERDGLWADTGGARCPLLPAASDVPPMAIAGPVPAPRGAPHLVLSGGSREWTVHNPPASLPSRYLSFLSNDPVVVELGNHPDAGVAQLTIRDVTDPMYRTTATNPFEVGLDDRYDFVAETALRPHHLDYGTPSPDPTRPGGLAREPGRRTPGAPLTYEFAVTLPAGGVQLVATISQDTRDVIRQEYRFHGRPFLSANPLIVPARTQIERAARPYFAVHFTAEEFADNNYFVVTTVRGRVQTVDPKNSYLLRGSEMFQVAEYLRRRYADHIEQRRATDPGAIPATVVSPALGVNSNWRNPERNENVGGVQNSNHQLGQAIDIAPVQKRGTAAYGALVGCLFAAARDLLQELIDRNGVAAFGDVEILLEDGPRALWSYTARPDGSIVDATGSRYLPVWGSPPSIELAAPHASHVHVAWKPRTPSAPLELPPAQADTAPPAVPTTFRNVILIASEHSSVPSEDRLPLNHLAESVKAYLADVDGQTTTEIHVVSNAVEWLEWLNAFETPTYRIRYLFSFSHAWPGGLELEHFPRSADYDSMIHKPAVLERLTELYDPRPFAETSNVLLPTGTDDLHTLKTNQIRIANLTWLPDEARQHLRRTFVDAEGIYIVGCRTAQEDGVPYPPFCAELANLINRPVRGANYYSKVFTPGADGEWHQRTITRDDPSPSEQPLVLVPGSYGTGQLVKFWWDNGLPPGLPDFPQSSNLFELYETFLNPCFPEES